MTRLQMFLGVVIVLMTVVMILAWMFIETHTSRASKSSSYVLDVKFEDFKKVMIRRNSLEEVISYQHGQLISQQWDNITLSSDKLLHGWEVDANGYFIVNMDMGQMGKMNLRLKQEVHLDKTKLHTVTTLMEPVGGLQQFTSTMLIEPQGEQTKVSETVTIVFKHKIPKNFGPTMDQLVDQGAAEALTKSREAILHLMSKYGNTKKFVIPIPMGNRKR